MLDTSLTALAHSDFMVLIPAMVLGPLHLSCIPSKFWLFM